MPGNNTKRSTRVRYREHPEPFVNEAIADLGRCAFWKCRKGPADLPEGHKMKVCSRCNKISLSRYYYCSRECQKNDWKDGHKLTCGLTRDVLDPLRLPNDPAKTGIPNAIPPFVQSTALGFQIKMIALAQPLHDYFVTTPELHPTPDIPITLQRLSTKARFHAMRNRAMRTGDQHAVYWMYNALIKSETEDLNPPLLRDQLGGEYGLKLEEGDDSKSELATGMSAEEIASASTHLGISINDLMVVLNVEGEL